MGTTINSGIKVRFNTEKFHRLIGRTSYKTGNLKGFHEELKDQYGLELKYSSWINMINNQRSSLDVLQVWMIADNLGVSVESLIEVEWNAQSGVLNSRKRNII